MSNDSKILLVEGDSDKYFFEKICKNLSLNTSVKVAPPKDLGGSHNSKQGALNHLSILLPQFSDGLLRHLALIVDADYSASNGLGCQKTIEQVSAIVHPFGFELKDTESNQNGLYFKHSDGFSDLGLWVMPDNQREGMLEDWIKGCVKDDEQRLFQQASEAVQNIPTPKFKSHLHTKAEVATWLAWQKQPGHGLYGAIKDNLLNSENRSFIKLERWLQKIFNIEA